MAHFTPCFHCPQKPTCADLAGLRTAMPKGSAGAKPTYIRVSCKRHGGMFLPGDRVKAMIGGIYVHRRHPVSGTVIQAAANGKWLIQVEPTDAESTGWEDCEGENSTGPRPFIKVYTDRIERLDEPRRLICDQCGNAKSEAGECFDKEKLSWRPACDPEKY